MATGDDYAYALNAYTKNIAKKIEDAVKRVVPDVNRTFLQIIDQKIKDIHKESVDKFYSSYSPYIYERDHSLYKILELDLSDSELRGEFNPNKMTGFRDGYHGEYGLYDYVFRKGWHGGADHGDTTTVTGFDGDFSYEMKIHTPHPNPGVPYWRVPVPYYTRWGRQAKISEPPLTTFKNKLKEYEDSPDGLIMDYNRAWRENMSKIVVHL